MSIIDQLKNNTLIKQIALIIGATILLVIISSWILSIYTRHGEAVSMPKLIGKKLDDVREELSKSDFELIVRDSIFDNKAPKNSVFSQDPAPGTKVKKHRKIYVTIVAMGAQKTEVPTLKDLSLRQATQMLESNGFTIAQIIYQPSEFENVVLEQQHKGKTLNGGELLEQGSAITLIVGKNGSSDEESDTEAPNE